MITVDDTRGSSYAAVLAATTKPDALARFRTLNIPLRPSSLRAWREATLPPPDAAALHAAPHWFCVASLTGGRTTRRYVIAPDAATAAGVSRSRGDGPSDGTPLDLGPADGLPFPFSQVPDDPSAPHSLTCPRCSYDLAGLPIALTVRCPECNLACALTVLYEADRAFAEKTSAQRRGCLSALRVLFMLVGMVSLTIMTILAIMSAVYSFLD